MDDEAISPGGGAGAASEAGGGAGAERGRTRADAGDDAAADGPPASCPTNDDGAHPASDLLELLGRAHAIRALYTLVHGVEPGTGPDGDPGGAWRFSELEAELDVSPNTLSARLDEFEAAGLVTRTQYEEIPPRVEYEATERARALDGVFRELRDWMREHDDGGG